MSALANSPAAWSDRAAAASQLDAVGWSAEGQADRFAAALRHLDLAPSESLLDYGCGTGAFSALLPADVAYTGFDWAPGMIVRAAREHPTRRFTRDYPSGRFDHVVAIGVWNLPGGWTKQNTFHTIRHLWDSTLCRTLVVSLYAGADERCLIYTEAELEQAGRNLGYGATVERHRPNDLLLAVRR